MGEMHLAGILAIVPIALLCGLLATRLRLPPLIGYMAAGIIVGPSGLGWVTDRGSVSGLADLGVLLLLYVLGMELSLFVFRNIWQKAAITTLIQVGGSVGFMFLVSLIFDWSNEFAVLTGFMLALSSTAVAVKLLETSNELRTRTGQLVIGVLIAQDILVMPMLLIVGNLATRGVGIELAIKIALSLGILGGVVALLSQRRRINLPLAKRLSPNSDLTPILGLTYCFIAAWVTYTIGLSPAYGAFLAGLVIGNSAQRQVMLDTVIPIQSTLMMVFFLSIGLLIDLTSIQDSFLQIALLLGVVIIFKTTFNIGVFALLRQPTDRALIGGAVLAPVGEFSFVLAQTGVGLALLSDADYRLLVVVTAMTLFLSPVPMFIVRRWINRGSEPQLPAVRRSNTIDRIEPHLAQSNPPSQDQQSPHA
ncbi:MAG: cation:proton antiporter [Alphaproteobacteria bacterium]